VLPVPVIVEEGLLLLQEVVKHHHHHLHLRLYQGHHLCHQVHPLLELMLVVEALVPVVAVVALELKLGGLVHSLWLMLLLHFQTL
jgi:hypothetical protein